MRPFAKTWCLVALVAACSDKPSIDLPPLVDRAPATGDGDSEPTAFCDQAPDGTSCGLEMHCIFNACVDNACGDGFVAGAEACDDGNERDHDGCSGRCNLEVSPGCGNGVLEPAEECDDMADPGSLTCTPGCTRVRCGDGVVSASEACDDGNTAETDGCTSRCMPSLAHCGDGKVDLGESCDDGNLDDGDGCEATCVPSPPPDLDAAVDDAGALPSDAGAGASDAGPELDAQVLEDAGHLPADAGTGEPDAGPPGPPYGVAHEKPGCASCREGVCTVYQGVFDLLAKCFHDPDPTFVQECVDLLDCAYANDCGYGPTGAPECFCGSVDLNTCQTAGKANGPCQAEFYAAARTTQLAELIGRFGDVSLPVGVAYYFVECDRDNCQACLP